MRSRNRFNLISRNIGQKRMHELNDRLSDYPVKKPTRYFTSHYKLPLHNEPELCLVSGHPIVEFVGTRPLSNIRDESALSRARENCLPHRESHRVYRSSD
jgi:hypothetical protein